MIHKNRVGYCSLELVKLLLLVFVPLEVGILSRELREVLHLCRRIGIWLLIKLMIPITRRQPRAGLRFASIRLDVGLAPVSNRECEAQKFHLYCHDVAFVKVNLHPHRG